MIAIKGAGEMASAVAWRLYMAKIPKICMLEVPQPLAVRRAVAFCEAVYEDQKTVESVEAVRSQGADAVYRAWDRGKIAVTVDPEWQSLKTLRPDVVIDAILAKKNLGTHMGEARVVIGLGPGFVAGHDVHFVIETNRGHNLGKVITAGCAESNTGVPGAIGGYSEERVLRAPSSGQFQARRVIGDRVKKKDVVGSVAGNAVRCGIEGVLRGLMRSGTQVQEGLKIGDIDPRGNVSYCDTISDKARAIAGSVLEAILRVYNSESN